MLLRANVIILLNRIGLYIIKLGVILISALVKRHVSKVLFTVFLLPDASYILDILGVSSSLFVIEALYDES